MKLSVQQQNLAEAANRAWSLLTATMTSSEKERSQQDEPPPWTGRILLEARNSTLFLRTSTRSSSLVSSCHAEIRDEISEKDPEEEDEEDGEDGNSPEPEQVLVEGQALHRIARQAAHDEVLELETREDRCLSVTTSQAGFDLGLFDPAGFPENPPSDLPILFKTSGEILKGLIEKTRHAIEIGTDTRHYLNGILLEITDARLTAVATDGRRLACASVEDPQNADAASKRFILPGRILKTLLSCIDPLQDITVRSDGRRIRFSAHGWELDSGGLEGSYPDWKRVLPDPKGLKTRVDFNMADIRTSLAQVSSTARDQIKVSIAAENGDLALRMESRTTSSGDRARECRASDQLVLTVNHEHLKDIFDQIEGEQAVLQIGRNDSPCMIDENLDNGMHTRFVIMPYRGGLKDQT